MLASQEHARQEHEGQGGCKPWGRDVAATSSLSFPLACAWLRCRICPSPQLLVPTSKGAPAHPFGVGLSGGTYTLHTQSRIGPRVFIKTNATPVSFSKPFASWLMQIAELFRQPLEAGRMWLGSFQYLRASWPWEGCELWLLSPLSQWIIAKVWNWCHNKCSGLGKSFEVRPERRDSALFPGLSLSHRCL